MSYVSLLTCTRALMAEKADLTSELSDIVMEISRENLKSARISKNYSDEKQSLADEYGIDSTQYQNKVADLKDEYNCQMADIQAWESGKDVQKQSTETRLTYVTGLVENFQKATTEGARKSFVYGGGGGTAKG